MNSCPNENCVLYDKPLSNTRDTPEEETPNFYVYVLSRDVWSDAMKKEYIGDVRIAASQVPTVMACQAQCVADARCKVISYCVMNACGNENCVLYDKPLSETRDTREGDAPNFMVYELTGTVAVTTTTTRAAATTTTTTQMTSFALAQTPFTVLAVLLTYVIALVSDVC